MVTTFHCLGRYQVRFLLLEYMMRQKKIICLHVPYERIVRHALSKPFIDLLLDRFEVKVLSPFVVTEDDLDYLGLDKRQFISYETNFSTVQKSLVQIIDYFRRYSYFFRNKDKYRLNVFFTLLTGEKYPDILKYAAKLAVQTRCDKVFWRLLDRIFWRLYTPQKILQLDLECDLFVQFSNWGINDYVIKNTSFARKARRVFFPYTTDQIYATGHFLHHFDKIYCQSQVEFEFLDLLHNYHAPAGIAGSLWYRHIDYLLENETIAQLEPGTIIYAGVSGEFFPKSSEVNFVNALQMQFPKNNVIYLPYFTKNESTNILDVLDNGIEVRTHETAMTELSTNSAVSMKQSVIKFLEKINGASLFVMSFNTSMGIDFSYLNKKTVFSYYYDEADQVKLGHYAKKERLQIYGSNYREVDLAYQFNLPDLDVVKKPASDRWDCDVELKKIVDELENLVKPN